MANVEHQLMYMYDADVIHHLVKEMIVNQQKTPAYVMQLNDKVCTWDKTIKRCHVWNDKIKFTASIFLPFCYDKYGCSLMVMDTVKLLFGIVICEVGFYGCF